MTSSIPSRETVESNSENEPSLSTLISNLPGFAFRCLNDDVWTMVFISDGVQAMTGYAPADFLAGKVFWDSLVHPDDVERVRASAARHIQQRTPIRISYRILAADGQVRWISDRSTPVYPATGEIEFWEGFVTDITERKQTEAALRDSEARQSLLLRLMQGQRETGDTNAMMAMAVEAVGRHLGANRVGFFEMRDDDTLHFTISWTDGVLAPLSGAFPATGIGTRYLAEVRAGRTLGIADTSLEPLTADSLFGEIGARSIIGAPIIRNGRWHAGLYVNHSEVRHWTGDEVALVRDVADQTWDAVERQRAEEALREADRRKDEFLAMLAHELRNPLAPIRNAVQVLKVVGPTDTRQQWAREVIERQTQHLARLVDDLLDVSRITRGKIKITSEPLDLETLLVRAVETSRPLIDARRHRLTVSFPADPVRLEGDLTRLVQTVGNLLNNAAKYTDPGGCIWLEAAREDEEAVIRVRDDGMGVAADLLPHVFDLFSQGDRSLDRSQGGLGIGLTLVRQLVEMHGGRVEAKSDGPGRGSEFIVRLPAVAPLVAAGAA